MENTSEIKTLMPLLLEAKGVVALTGSGISAECGIPTFRGEAGDILPEINAAIKKAIKTKKE